jgi:hypothetical protein
MNIVTSPEIFKDGSARAGIEALLCYHGYSWTGTFVQFMTTSSDGKN